MSKEYEYDDKVYEDGYYEENLDEEELKDSDEEIEEEGDFDKWSDDDDENDDAEVKVTLSYVCEDCDYRWEEVVTKRKDMINEDDPEPACMMCGSVSVSQI